MPSFFFSFSSVFLDLALESDQGLRGPSQRLCSVDGRNVLSSPRRGAGALGTAPCGVCQKRCEIRACLSLSWQEPQVPMECFVPERGADTGTHMTGACGGQGGGEREL